MPEARKPLWRRLIEFRLLFLVNAIILIALGISFGREWVRNRDIEQEISRLQSEAEALQARNLKIADLNTAFQTESFIEREARLKLGMKKPGENVVVIRDVGEGEPVAATDSSEQSVVEAADPRTLLALEDNATQLANPSKWWHYFFR